METRKLRISELLLWDENARFPDKYYNNDERNLINYFIEKPEHKIKLLIEAVVKDFDLPQLEKLVVWNDESNFITLEGNRRVAAYKLLIDPELSNNQKLKTFLYTQKGKISIDSDFELECIVTADKNEGFRYIDRKHVNSNNEVNWQEPERVNYSTRRGSDTFNNSLKSGITSIVRNLDIIEDFKDRILGKGFVTNFFRAITSTAAKKKYGYKITDNGELIIENPNFNDELKVVIFSILNKEDLKGNKVDSRTLNKNENIEEFLQSIDVSDSQKVDEQIRKNTNVDIFGQESINIGNGTTVISPQIPKPIKNKSKPIPKGLFFATDVPFKIKSSSLRLLYEELKEIDVAQFPNATHDLLRSFLECSLLFYFKEIKEFDKIQRNSAHNPKLGEMLAHIIKGNSVSIKDVNVIETLKLVKTDYDQPYSLERMNMINHNENCASTEKDVRKAWGQVEPLFKIILNPAIN